MEFISLKNKPLSVPNTTEHFEIKGKVACVQKNSKRCEILIQLKDKKVQILLCGTWFNTQVRPHDVIFVRSLRQEDDRLLVDNQQGMVTVNPDKMITSTAMAKSVFCLRSSWLSEMYKGFGSGNKEMLVGNLVHELFQNGCLKKLTDPKEYENHLNNILQSESVMLDIYSNSLTTELVRESACFYIPHIIQWIQKFLISENGDQLEDKTKVKVTKVLDIEDNIWTPAFGIKGKVDLTLEINLESSEKTKTKKIVPLELKTGRHVHNFEHKGQVSLYTMMLDDRVDSECDSGLLLYLKDNVDMELVTANEHIKRSLLQLRNELAFYKDRLEKETPEVKNIYRLCSKCSHRLDCCLTVGAFDAEQLEKSQEMREQLIPEVIGHLSEKDIDFFRNWTKMIFLEGQRDEERAKAFYFWDEPSEQREASGYGLAKLAYKSNNGLNYIFTRHSSYSRLGKFLNSNSLVKKGERITLTVDEQGELVKIANISGYIREISTDQVEVTLGKHISAMLQNRAFRLDATASSYSNALLYGNILKLLQDEPESLRLRKLLVHEKRATFQQKLSTDLLNTCKPLLRELNTAQQRCVLRAMNANDYLLIRGSPGSGKTQTIVAIVRTLLQMGKSVLITSHTHIAVDNILLKLMQFSVTFLRLGSRNRIHPQLHVYSEGAQLDHIKKAEELDELYQSCSVVACSCAAVGSHPLFLRRSFDYCLVDEASQILLPETLGALFCAQKFILVGDPKQLPPVVRSQEARSMGMDKGLFDALQREENSISLNVQYRMNIEIQRIANEFVYEQQLQCANDQVERACVELYEDEKKAERKKWLQKCISPKMSNAVLFLNTDECDALHQKDEAGLVSNMFEVQLVAKIIQTFFKFGIEPQAIGVITPYQKQVHLMRSLIACDGVEVNTVDQYQGRDKDIILISFVRSSEESFVASGNEILSDERRLNVAVTRARRKMILIGSRQSLICYEPMERLFKILREEQIVRLCEEPFRPESLGF